jgi:toxin ParE1/3/4
MANYRLSKKAIFDLKSIWEYTFERWSENQADKYYQMLIECFDEVSSNPKSGKSYSIVFDDLKGYKAGRHVIFYIETEEGFIDILRILHERMDLKNRMKEK